MNLLNSLSSRVSFSKEADNTWIVNELQCGLIRVGKTPFQTKNKVVPSSYSRSLQLPAPVARWPGHPVHDVLWMRPEPACLSPEGCTHVFGGWCSPSPCFTSRYLGQCQAGRQKQNAAMSHGPNLAVFQYFSVRSSLKGLYALLIQWFYQDMVIAAYKSIDVTPVVVLRSEILLTAVVTCVPFLPTAANNFIAAHGSAWCRAVPNVILLK